LVKHGTLAYSGKAFYCRKMQARFSLYSAVFPLQISCEKTASLENLIVSNHSVIFALTKSRFGAMFRFWLNWLVVVTNTSTSRYDDRRCGDVALACKSKIQTRLLNTHLLVTPIQCKHLHRFVCIVFEFIETL